MVKAVVDVGSNSVLLAVSRRQGERWTPILETSEVTALGEGVKVTGVLSERAMTDTLAAMSRARFNAQQLGAEQIRFGITMAGRIAKNTPEFLDRCSKNCTPAMVLSGDDEAELGFRAVANDPICINYERISIIDVGGHSTEIVTADRDSEMRDRWHVRFRRSFEIGTLALRSGVLSGQVCSPPAILKASAQIDDSIGLIYLPHQCGATFALGATGTNLVTIRERMSVWQPDKVHGAILDYEEISRAFGWMAGMNDAERAAIVGIESGREKTLHLGALILERFMNALRAEQCTVTVRGWRHAMLTEDRWWSSEFGE